jgi:hypothetical protein
MASPRSGSNLLEETIYNMISPLATPETPAIKLDEFLHYEWFSYRASNGQYYSGKQPFNSEIRTRHRDDIKHKIETDRNPVTMRIFPQLWHKEFINLTDFFSHLEKNNFKFVYLHRNLRDRLISLSVAQTTNLWHKRIINQKIVLSIDGGKQVPLSKENKITIDLESLTKTYYETRVTDFYLGEFFKKFPGPVINYETFNDDCIRTGIKIADTDIKKLYDVDYRELVSNYDEVVEFIEWF